jgi:hypothetical protein
VPVPPPLPPPPVVLRSYYNPNTQTYQSGPADRSPQYFNPATGGYYPTVTNTHT